MISHPQPLARFDGKVVAVTGATGGLGRACCLRLSAEGAAVVVAGRRADACSAVVEEIIASGGEAVAAIVDVTDPVTVKQLVETAVSSFGQLDGAVNNAGVSPAPVLAAEYPDDVWQHTLDTNVNALFHCLRKELSYMVGRGSGAIVNVGSYVAANVQTKGILAYSASKHAILGMTRAAARDYASIGVRVNAVAPGHIRTAMIDRNLTPEGEKALLARIPMGRISEPAEIAAAVAFLLSDDASFITGQMLVADGGLTI